jgi:redox-sensitive bicupin YhaK (pirin superfamily)
VKARGSQVFTNSPENGEFLPPSVRAKEAMNDYTHFSVGDQVIIRYGRHQGQKGKIIKSQQADVYEVRVEDGSVLFFSGKGLDKEK